MQSVTVLEIVVALIQVALGGLLAWGGLLSFMEKRREERASRGPRQRTLWSRIKRGTRPATSVRGGELTG